LRKRGRYPAVVLASGYAEFEYARQAITLEVTDYLLKPVEREKLVEAVEKALEAGRRSRKISLVERMADDRLLALERRAPANPAIREAIAHVEAHLGEAIGLKETAALVHMNASYFSALFKEQCGMTFSEFVTRKRVAKAKELLLTTDLSVEEIAARVGYQTAKYFVSVFKEQVGQSPHRYRKWAMDENGD
jgi:YesN/AraC family two-component response regulator